MAYGESKCHVTAMTSRDPERLNSWVVTPTHIWV